MSRRIKNRLNIRYGRLIVKEFVGTTWDDRTLWKCICDCGNETIVRGKNLQGSHTKSCGCLQRETASKLGEKRLNKNAPNYIHGKYCGVKELKEKIRKRDNYTCQECGRTQEQNLKETDRVLDVHHIDSDDTNNIDENMITLCMSCHGKIV